MLSCSELLSSSAFCAMVRLTRYSVRNDLQRRGYLLSQACSVKSMTPHGTPLVLLQAGSSHRETWAAQEPELTCLQALLGHGLALLRGSSTSGPADRAAGARWRRPGQASAYWCARQSHP